MNVAEFKAAIEADRAMLARGIPLPGMSVCAECGVPLQSGITGNRVLGDGTHNCDDCWFTALGREIDEFPIGGLRGGRFGRGGLASPVVPADDARRE